MDITKLEKKTNVPLLSNWQKRHLHICKKVM